MNILFINHYAGSEYHGMMYRHYYLAQSMIEDGHNVSIIASSESHLRHKQPIINGDISIENINGIQFIWLKTVPYHNNGFSRLKNMFHFTWLLYRFRKKIIEQVSPSCIVDCTPYLLTFYPAFILKKISNSKLLHEVRDVWPETLIDVGGHSKYHPFILLLRITKNFAYRNADKIVSALPATKDHMMKHGMESENFAYIPNGIVPYSLVNTIEDYSMPKEHLNLLNKLKIQYKHIVGYTGAHSQANSIDIFLESASSLEDKSIAFVFVGDGNAKTKFITYAKDNNITNAYFLPPVEKKVVPIVLEYFDIGLVGGRVRNVHKYGVCPNKLMDYMFFGLPVLLAIKTDYSPIHSSKGGLVVDPTNPESITAGIMTLLSMDKLELLQMGKNARNFIIDNHDYTVLAKKYINTINSI